VLKKPKEPAGTPFDDAQDKSALQKESSDEAVHFAKEKHANE